ncbi:tRNA (adenosine(37)-N6)-threonylcarbamoyltransferase complex transferase subunit TsaD [Leptolyngbya sp. FACHB-261]|uniref:tRNA (adenosine(37)-N6)-threonylcarbamoyltransferase complex transferase subunit TsaD n=1 Tax=Leptolyngbya sp. FACHB-261 TaxID=2692806 RepID=UPI001687732A|nr:tRNA (adenosine(37)-N6)-threonylcarbamoyltransferase complex transferase subunit TsaD [Leptolyngbya sp. FACHB-261]MBD2104692.1 tRNA (adenosine(37)-N6)-threonylcarbamoyltransferase complex transferase subunit TsaD [Leptolyngbya sp. FACHB-261]
MVAVLAIETSCDETSVAVVENYQVHSNLVASQIDLHRQYGGVVPEVASRQHVETLNPLIADALAQSGLGWDQIDGIAVTCAPGLVGALLVGLTAAKTLALVHNKPLVGVHHLEGHLYAAYLSEPELKPPFLYLLVSGGHTSLIAVRDHGLYELLGQTRDDAAGEAFDKVARLLGLEYPGGPAIDRVAHEGNPQAFALPEGKVSLGDGSRNFHPYDTSFSGLKTAMLRLVQQFEREGKPLPVADLAASFQETVARVLTKRTLACALDHDLSTIIAGGGVAANSRLRSQLTQAAAERGVKVIFPPLKFCTDNAAMIGCAGVMHLAQGHVSPLTLGVQSRLALTQVMSLYS